MKQLTFSLLLAFICLNTFAVETTDSVLIAGKIGSVPVSEKIDSIPVAVETDSVPKPEKIDSITVSVTSDSVRTAGIKDSIQASEKPDSCYVFAELRWDPGFFSYSAKIIYTDFMEDIKDENGKKLKFNGFIRAVNYMSIQGWEVMQIYPYHFGDKEREQIAILRKRVSIEEAQSVSQPKTK